MKHIGGIFAVVLFGLIGWVLTELAFYIGKPMVGNYLAILIHFVLSPLIFIILSYIYFRYINMTGSLITAAIIAAILILLDLTVVALFIEKSYWMFFNVMATWMPFLLIFLSVFLTGQNFNDRSLN